jgi:acetyl esterase/lipase
VASTSYRLCPQNQFPAPLLDVLLAYASLLSLRAVAGIPASTRPSKIILAGNSAGVNLAMGLTKFLLEFNKRADPTALFHGRRIHLPVPAGIISLSGWCDPTDCLPSWLNPNALDILTPLQPALWPQYPPDNVWPSTPPREHLYTRAMNLDHELICPAAVRDWTGAPPMWFAVGELERGRDGNAVVASQAARCGVNVTWTEWQGVCHEYMIVTRGLPQGAKTFDLCAEACIRFLRSDSAGHSTNTAMMYCMPSCDQVDIEGGVNGLMSLLFESIRQLMWLRNKQRPVWTGDSLNKDAKVSRL